jgi:hypothetical protein
MNEMLCILKNVGTTTSPYARFRYSQATPEEQERLEKKFKAQNELRACQASMKIF